MIGEDDLARIDSEAVARVDAAVAFADASPFPAPESLYDDVYVLDDAVRGSYSVRTTRPEEAADQDARAGGPGGLDEDGEQEISQQITTALQAGEDGS